MSSKRNHNPGCKACTCSVCGVTAHATPGRYHRRCTGQPIAEGQSTTVRSKHDCLPKCNRGKWA